MIQVNHQQTFTRNIDIWSNNLNRTEERKLIHQFWLELSKEERRCLILIEKETVLRKIKEQQKQACNCSICGRKRHNIESELETLYDAYFEELEKYAYLQLKKKEQEESDTETEDEDEHDEDEDEDIDEDEDSFVDFELSTDSNLKQNVQDPTDDSLKTDGEKLLNLMYDLSEKKKKREQEVFNEALEENTDEDQDENTDLDEEDHDSDNDCKTDEQKKQDGLKMFTVFAARMFEQRVLAAYREKIAQDRQRRLIEELEEEERRRQERELKKQKEKEEKKNKRRLLKLQQEKENIELINKKRQEELAEKLKQEQERQQKEQERLIKEQERQLKEQERQKKELERIQRENERKKKKLKEREEAERKRKEEAEIERKRKEEAEKKRREEEAQIKRREEEEAEKKRKEKADAEKKRREAELEAEAEAEKKRKELEVEQNRQQEKKAESQVFFTSPDLPNMHHPNLIDQSTAIIPLKRQIPSAGYIGRPPTVNTKNQSEPTNNHSFYSDHPFDRTIKYSKHERQLDLKWTNGWTPLNTLSNIVHTKMFSDIITNRYAMIIERTKVAYKKLNEMVMSHCHTKPFYHTLTQLHLIIHEIYKDEVVIDIREMYETINRYPDHEFKCVLSEQQGYIVYYDPPNVNLAFI